MLAQEADELLDALKSARVVLDPDIDRSELEVSEYPLKTVPSASDDRLKWTITHLKIYDFQSLYIQHLNHVTQREEGGFDSGIRAYPVSGTNTAGAEDVAKLLKSHATALRDQAAKLIAAYSASAAV